MTDLNAKAAECMGWVTEVQGNGWVMWQEARDAKVKILKSGFFSSGGAKYDVWNPKKNIAQAWLLVEKCVENGLYVDVGVLFWPPFKWYCEVEDKTADEIIFRKYDTAPEAITAACVEALSKCPK